ncbi:hypothetical protein PV433_31855 [Paenibacillus sp. GYB004]|uniref:hypothetical protein n=1 Tax=Paenibacillus sp. GYB004 TaxID=2994393 RepID=UPI002F9629C9
MATIVVHKRSGIRYVLIGTGYGAYKSQLPSVFGGSVFPREETGEIPLAAVSDKAGNIEWILTDELVVAEVDGQPPHVWLEQEAEPVTERESDEGGLPSPPSRGQTAGGEDQAQSYELCPGCEHRVVSDARECPSCGLVLIVSVDESEGST